MDNYQLSICVLTLFQMTVIGWMSAVCTLFVQYSRNLQQICDTDQSAHCRKASVLHIEEKNYPQILCYDTYIYLIYGQNIDFFIEGLETLMLNIRGWEKLNLPGHLILWPKTAFRYMWSIFLHFCSLFCTIFVPSLDLFETLLHGHPPSQSCIYTPVNSYLRCPLGPSVSYQFQFLYENLFRLFSIHTPSANL